MNDLKWSEFQKVDMRVGTITDVKNFPEANNPALKLWIDFGEEIGIKKTSAQITNFYNGDNLRGKQVIAVINFPAKQIANFMSECLVIGAVGENGVTLIEPDQPVKNGLRIS